MESFTIQCTSCQSRIRVRNPKMIGQIANCPKCNSMIMITAPQQITVESGNVTDSVAVTREALPPPDPQAFENFDNISFDQGFRSDGLPESPGNAQPLGSMGGMDDDDLPRLAPEAFDNIPSGTWSPVAAPPRTGEQVASAAAALQAKRLQAINKQRQILFIAAIGLCSVLVAGGGLFLFLRMFRSSKPIAQNNAVPIATKPDANKPDANKPDNTKTDTPPTVNESNQGSPVQDSNATGDAQGTTSKLNADAASNTSSEPGNSPPSPVAKDANPLVASTPPPNIGSPLAGTVAPSIDSVFADPATSTAAATSGAPGSTELPPGLMSFAELFGQTLEPALPDATVPLDKATEVPEDASVKNGNAATPPLTALPKDVDKRLKLEIRGLRIDKRPLSDAMLALASAGDFPIVADLDSLAIGGHEVNPLVDFTSTESISLGDAIQKIAAASGLEFASFDNQALIVRPTNDWISQHVPASLPIQDLVANAEESDALVAAIRSVLPELGSAIQVSDGSLVIALDDQNRFSWYQVARLLERWRAERGIANAASAKIVPESSRLPKWPTEIQKQLAITKIKNFLPAEPLVRSWQRLCGEAGIVCWVDWLGLKFSDIAPTQTGSVMTLGRPMIDILGSYSERYDIVFAVEDDQSLWITSKLTHRMQPRLYVIPVGDKSLDQWREELVPLSPLDPTTGAPQLILVPAPGGKHIFARCCRPTL